MSRYQHVYAEVFHKPWAILPEKLSVISELVLRRAAGQGMTEQEIRATLKAAALIAGPRNSQTTYGTVAVLPIYGVITKRANLMSQFSGGCSVEKLTAQFRAALADPSVKAVVFDVDSPGGGVDGVDELAAEIFDARGKKKTVAIANSMAASAAYWLACSASEFVMTPSGYVGSIGVFTAHEDISAMLEKMGVKVTLIGAGKFKTEGNEFEPLSDEAKAHLQDQVDAFYGMFVKAVARGRKVSQAAVKSGFGQGRIVLSADAVKQGMVDRTATLDQTIARLGGATANPQAFADTMDPKLKAQMDDGPTCDCECESCQSGMCSACTMANCMDPVCAQENCPNQAKTKDAAPASGAQKPLLEQRRRKLDLIHRL